MERAFTEGNGVLYYILVGIPLNKPLHDQLIPQLLDKYHNLKEDDYLDALGIKPLYAALVNAEESPEHLIHLAHALGHVVKDTNTLSDSKPNTWALDPLPPMKAIIMDPCLAISKTFTYIDDNPMHIDINNDDPCMMDMEGVRDGDSDKDNSNNSRDDMDGQRKRKSVNWLVQYSPPVLLLLSLNKDTSCYRPLLMEMSEEETVVPDQVESSTTKKCVEEAEINDTAM
ncbi:hypothetical protein BD769DRAFT_1390527 [Suillus cothurnatus]|nr:hypothetical protein BD769DRAFT_1390527 [Suillus cothurnatus]